ncbi:MAG: hypothetical protein ACQESN_05370, partial [Thermotogota bacterium]
MKKTVFFALTVILLIALLSSCNLQTVRVKGTPKLEAPLGATSIVINDFIGDFESELENSLSGLTKVKDNPLTFRFATDLVNISMSDFFSKDQINFSDFQESVSFGFDIPELPSLASQNISLPTIDPENSNVDYTVNDLDVPSSVDVSETLSLSVEVPNTGGSEVIIDETSLAQSITATGFDSITLSQGTFDVNVGMSVPLDTVEVKLKVLNNSDELIAESGYVDISDGNAHSLSIDLTDKTLSSTFNLQPVFKVNTTTGSPSTSEDITIDILGITNGKISAASGVEFEETFSNSNVVDLSLDADAFATAT